MFASILNNVQIESDTYVTTNVGLRRHLLLGSVVNKDLTLKAKDLTLKAKAKNLILKAKAKDLTANMSSRTLEILALRQLLDLCFKNDNVNKKYFRLWPI